MIRQVSSSVGAYCNAPLLLILFIFISSCFSGGLDKRGSVTGYHNGIVLTEGGKFRVGALPPYWKETSFSYRSIFFSHASLQASISVDAFCKGSFDDAPLPVLSSQLSYGLGAAKKIKEQRLMLDGHEALRRVVSGTMDGAAVQLDSVVLKMNECVFDFIYTSNPSAYSEGVRDFEGFYGGFQYITGPPINSL